MVVAVVGLLASISLAAQPLDGVCESAANAAIEKYKSEDLKPDQLACTVLDITDPANVKSGSFRGDKPFFPASVVKLFYLVAAQQWLEEGKLQPSDELSRTMNDMIVDSSNDATAMIVDALTETLNGAPLPDDQMQAWAEKRNSVNRYFTTLGFTGINVNQKTYCEGPYGRERIFFGEKFFNRDLNTNRNQLTTDATAELFRRIVEKKVVTPPRCDAMMKLLSRDMKSDNGQATGYTAKALPAGSKLWSKAGWTNTARHDAAYVELPDGRKLVIVVFTTNHAKNNAIVSDVAKAIIEESKRN